MRKEQREVMAVRVLLVFAVILALFVPLTRHLYHLQIVRHEELLSKARRKSLERREEIAARGRIYDASGNLLAGNVACRDILAEPWRFTQHTYYVVDLLCRELALDRAELTARFEQTCSLTEKNPRLIVAEAVPTDRVEELVSFEFEGLSFTASQSARGRPAVLDQVLQAVHGQEPAGLPQDVVVAPRRLGERRGEVIQVLHEMFDLDPGDLDSRFTEALRGAARPVEVVVARSVEISRAERVERLLEDQKISGIRFVDGFQRHYPKGRLLSNTIGILRHASEDEAIRSGVTGLFGVEKLLDPLLQPVPGEEVFECDARGRAMDWRPIRSTPPRPGGDVYLTIEEPIQHTVEQELDLIMETFKPLAAYAVMADPRTGRILAMAQRPTFDPNDRSPGNMAPEKWINRVVSTGFEPGSVMKGISVAGAIDYGVVTLDHVFDCEKGYWVYARRPLRDSHRFEDLSVLEILQHSSNIGTAKIALEMGERRLYQTLWRFGFGQRTGIGFDDEGTGLLRPVNRWDGLSVTRFPIGQGILTTPLQLVQAFSALANNGNMMQLRVVDRVADPTTGETKLFPPVLRRRVVAHESAIRDVVTALKMVTTDDGTASKAAIEGYEVAGKTGTAQKYIREELPDHKGYTGYYSNSKYVGSFIGFVPADDPAFVLLVSVDEPTEGGYYGGTVAAPSFRRIAASTLRYLQIPPGNSGETIRDVVSTNSSSETVSVLR